MAPPYRGSERSQPRGTGENPISWSPESVSAWVAAIAWLEARPEVGAGAIGAFGISRGGYLVLQLAGAIPDRVRAVVANAGHPFGYRMTDDELDTFVRVRNRRATWLIGEPDHCRSRRRPASRSWPLSSGGHCQNRALSIASSSRFS
jgi:dienelactone hydrolase